MDDQDDIDLVPHATTTTITTLTATGLKRQSSKASNSRKRASGSKKAAGAADLTRRSGSDSSARSSARSVSSAVCDSATSSSSLSSLALSNTASMCHSELYARGLPLPIPSGGIVTGRGNGGAAGITIPSPVAGKRGGGFSCHCCKTTKKNIDELFLCTNHLPKDIHSMKSILAAQAANDEVAAGKGVWRTDANGRVKQAGKSQPEVIGPHNADIVKKCAKKYCISCMKRLYCSSLMSLRGRNRDEWSCPSCLNRCTCAGCERRISGLAEAPWRGKKKEKGKQTKMQKQKEKENEKEKEKEKEDKQSTKTNHDTTVDHGDKGRKVKSRSPKAGPLSAQCKKSQQAAVSHVDNGNTGNSTSTHVVDGKPTRKKRVKPIIKSESSPTSTVPASSSSSSSSHNREGNDNGKWSRESEQDDARESSVSSKATARSMNTTAIQVHDPTLRLRLPKSDQATSQPHFSARLRALSQMPTNDIVDGDGKRGMVNTARGYERDDQDHEDEDEDEYEREDEGESDEDEDEEEEEDDVEADVDDEAEAAAEALLGGSMLNVLNQRRMGAPNQHQKKSGRRKTRGITKE